MVNPLANAEYRPIITLGNWLTIGTVLLSIGALVWAFSGRITTIERDLMNEIQSRETARIENLPKIDKALVATQLQDEKIERLSSILEANQEAITKLTEATNDLRVLVAVLSSKTGDVRGGTGVNK